MKNLNTMQNDVVYKLNSDLQEKIRKYRNYMDLISKCFSVVIPPVNFDDVASYIVNKKIIRLRYHHTGIHYDYIDISVDMGSRKLKIEKFFAHDAYYNPSISPSSDDKDIVDFFKYELNNFVNWFRDENQLISVKKLVKAINDGIFNAYETDFKKLNINEYTFGDSEYALKLDVYEEEITSKIKTLCEKSGLVL